MGEGWIKLHRSIVDNWLWGKRPFSKGQAWIDILLLANHAPHRMKTRTGFVDIDRGSFHTEERTLQARWGWSGSKVRQFVQLLESEKMIQKTVKKSSSGKSTEGTTIKVLNYGIYQDNAAGQKSSGKSTKKAAGKQRGSSGDAKQEPLPLEEEECKSDFAEALENFREMRVAIKKPLVGNAEHLILKKLNEIATDENEKIEVLNKSTRNGWRDIYPLKESATKTPVPTKEAIPWAT